MANKVDERVHKSAYDDMHSKERVQFLQRARHNALLTNPSAMPLEGRSHDSHMIESYQGLGAFAVDNLTNRMTTALLPAGRPFMRLDLTPQVRLQNEGEVPTSVEKGLALTEQLIQAEVEAKDWRSVTMVQVEQLQIAGTVAERQNEDNTLETFRLDQIVCKLNNKGFLLDLIVLRPWFPEEIPSSIASPSDVKVAPKDQFGRIETYTRVTWDANKEIYRETTQTSEGRSIGSEATYTEAEMPWHVFTWNRVPGESYGRSKVEVHAGDLRSLETLEKAGLELASMAAFHFIAVRPGATAPGIRNRLKEIQNGGVLMGDPESMELKSFENGPGYQITQAHIQGLVDRISRGFLLLSGIRRDAERVTAEEIRADIDEIENAVGGVFGTLAQRMMAKRTELLLRQMQEQGKAPEFDANTVSPKILTGLEALSREREATAAMQGAQIVQAFGPDAVDVVKLDKLMSRAFIGLGLPDMIRSEEEANARREQRLQSQTAADVASAAAGPVAGAAAQQATGGQ